MEISIKEWNVNFGSDKDVKYVHSQRSILKVLILLFLQKLLIMKVSRIC